MLALCALVLPTSVHAENVLSFKTVSGVTEKLRVKVNAASVVEAAGVADEDAGVALTTAAANTNVAVVMHADGEVATYVANGAITAGVDVYPAASGKVSATVGGKRIGKAFTTTTTDGDAIKVLKLAPAADRVLISHSISAASVDDWVFIADRAYTVVSIKEVHGAEGTDAGAATGAVRKVTAVAAPGAAAGATVKEFLTTAFDLKSTANTTVTGTLTATAADLNLAAGDKIGVNFVGVLTGLDGGVIVIELKAR